LRSDQLERRLKRRHQRQEVKVNLAKFLSAGLTRITSDQLPPLYKDSRARRPRRLSAAVPDQDSRFWCWAAVATGIADFYGNAMLQQHLVAAGVLGRSCQPRGAAPPNCDCAGSLESALCYTDNLAGATIPGTVSLATIISAIDAGRPVCARIADHSTGHFAVITGYGASSHLHIDDPWLKDQFPSYAHFVKGYCNYKWTATYMTKSHLETPHCTMPLKVPTC
jgi:papain like cysteine protease AvrRpt2